MLKFPCACCEGVGGEQMNGSTLFINSALESSEWLGLHPSLFNSGENI